MAATRFGFRIVGGCFEERRLVDWSAAFLAYCRCDEQAHVKREAYLSAFVFGPDFRKWLDDTGSVRDFVGACWSPWIWWDIDREGDIEHARRDTARLALHLDERYRLPDDGLLLFVSGGKGFHVGLPTSLFAPEPSPIFHKVARHFAGVCAERSAVTIDDGVYDRVRAFRAPNSRHPKTGLHKRRLTLDEVLRLSTDAILKLGAEPLPFDLPEPIGTNTEAVQDWLEAVETVEREAKAVAVRHAQSNGKATLNRRTLEFIRDGANNGDRHRLLYSAARNLGECGSSFELAFALLSEAALDSGLSPNEVRRQIECGICDVGKTEGNAP
jgi:hypothetical protein